MCLRKAGRNDAFRCRYAEYEVFKSQIKPETAREVRLVIFPKIMAEVLQRHEISKRHLKFKKSTTKLLCSIKSALFHVRDLQQINKNLQYFIQHCTVKLFIST